MEKRWGRNTVTERQVENHSGWKTREIKSEWQQVRGKWEEEWITQRRVWNRDWESEGLTASWERKQEVEYRSAHLAARHMSACCICKWVICVSAGGRAQSALSATAININTVTLGPCDQHTHTATHRIHPGCRWTEMHCIRIRTSLVCHAAQINNASVHKILNVWLLCCASGAFSYPRCSEELNFITALILC